MNRAKIIVTSNPSNWEGDFRLMEAFASGALIFVDDMYVPRPHPFIHDRHIVYYDNNNKTDVFDKLDYYRKNIEHARRIAVNGYLHAMKYHRATSFIDYVFRTIECKKERYHHHHHHSHCHHYHYYYHHYRAAGKLVNCLEYTMTGYDLRNKALTKTAKNS